MDRLNSIENKAQILNVNKSFLSNTLKEIMAILEAENGSLFIFDAENKQLVLDSYRHSNEIYINDIKIKRSIGEGVTGKVVEFKSPVLVMDIDNDPRFRGNGFNHYSTKSFISIPLFASDTLIGVINISDKSSGEPFSEKDLQFAVTLCKYACVIIGDLLNPALLTEEKEILDKQKVMLEKYASVGKLAAGIVHQVNNPLDGITRYTNMLLNHLHRDDSITKEYLLEIKKGLNRIGSITKSLLEFSHIVNSDSPKFRKYVLLPDLIEEALEVSNIKLEQNIQIVKKYDTGLPGVLDFGLSHVLVNIIKNAMDAMPRGGALEISTELKDSIIYISFKDTGVGIASDIKENIFKPFFTTKNIDKGTGLGLAISKEIINKYDGQIEMQSSQGVGSTFTILIPKKYLRDE